MHFVSHMISPQFSWCFRAQPLISVEGASKHVANRTSAAELFYLRHVRSCAASAFGHRCTCSGATSGICISCMVQFLAMLMAVVQSMKMLLTLVKAMSIVLVQMMQLLLDIVLQSMPSPLEIGACIVLAGGGDPECHGGQLVLAAFVLMLALCDWHVPLTVPLHYKVCRLLSALSMHAHYPTSATMICLAFADPTFGKRAKTSAAPASGQTEPGASEHTSGTSEHDMAIGAAKHIMSGKISLDDAIEKLQIHKEADELASKILAAAITLRDCEGRDRLVALRKMAVPWKVARQAKMEVNRKIDHSML